MRLQQIQWSAALATLAGALAAIASSAGVLLRGDLTTQAFTTVRGDVVEVLTGGIYRFNGLNVASEGVGWDLVTLLLVVPALALLLPFAWRGSLRAALGMTGILAYFLYQYFEYATFLAYGPLFLVYVAIAGLSLSGIAVAVGAFDLAALGRHVRDGFPHRGVIGFGIYMALLLGGLWLGLIGRTYAADQVTELYGATTLVVQAFDLAILVPLGLFTAATVHRRLGVGYLLAAIVVVKGMAMGTAIGAMLVIEGLATGVWQPAPISIFAATAIVSAVLAGRVFGALGGDTARTPSRTAAAPATAM